MKNHFSITYKHLVYVALGFIFYILFLNQGLGSNGPLGKFFSDIPPHTTRFSAPYLHQNWFKLFTEDFEPLTHIPIAVAAYFFNLFFGNEERLNLFNAAALVLTSAKLAEFAVTKWILNRTVKLTEAQSFFVALIMIFCTVPYLPFLTLNMYIPMGTPNLWHNPPNILLTPFAVLFFYLYISSRKLTFHPQYAYALSLFLIITTLIKPSFTCIMLVTVAISYLFDLQRFASKHFINDLIIFVPTGILVFLQTILIEKSQRGGNLVFTPYMVIGYYTKHPFYALLQAIEFPLLITIVYFIFKKYKNNDSNDFQYMEFAWIFCGCSYFLFALFSLTQFPLYADLMWPFLVGMTLLYVFSIILCVKLLTENTFDKSSRRLLILKICSINLVFIFISGLHQFMKIFLGGSYV